LKVCPQPRVRAVYYALLGDNKRVIELLNEGIEDGYLGVFWANVWPEFDPLRDDPRFTDLLRRMNLEP